MCLPLAALNFKAILLFLKGRKQKPCVMTSTTAGLQVVHSLPATMQVFSVTPLAFLALLGFFNSALSATESILCKLSSVSYTAPFTALSTT